MNEPGPVAVRSQEAFTIGLFIGWPQLSEGRPLARRFAVERKWAQISSEIDDCPAFRCYQLSRIAVF